MIIHEQSSIICDYIWSGIKDQNILLPIWLQRKIIQNLLDLIEMK